MPANTATAVVPPPAKYRHTLWVWGGWRGRLLFLLLLVVVVFVLLSGVVFVFPAIKSCAYRCSVSIVYRDDPAGVAATETPASVAVPASSNREA